MNTRVVAIVGGASLVSAAAGAVAGYFFAKKRLVSAFDEEMKTQLADAEKLFKMKHKVGMYSSPVEMAERRVPAGQVTPDQEEAARVALAYSGGTSSVTDLDLQKIIRNLRRTDTPVPAANESLLGLGSSDISDVEEMNIFDDHEDEWPTYEGWLAKHPRNDVDPHILTNAEFHNAEVGYETYSLTWYDEDGVSGKGVLTDEQDAIIPNADEVVGEDNMDRFGMWSGQDNVIYICNPRLQSYFEVTRYRGSYAEAMGMVIPENARVSSGRGRGRSDDD